MFIEVLDKEGTDDNLKDSSVVKPSGETKESDSTEDTKDLNVITEKPNDDLEDEESVYEFEDDFLEEQGKDSNVQQSQQTTIKMTSNIVETTYNSSLSQNWNKEPIMTQLLDYYAEQV